MAGPRKVEKDQYLFRDGDPPDAMYVVKSGKLAVVKVKQNSEIVLAELGPGAMVGEMAFFDGKPRSASVKALKDSELIALPYKSLHAQFETFPEWCKAIMRTVNDHLRNANQRLRQLEKPDTDEDELFAPHTITKLFSILNLIGHKYGETVDGGVEIPSTILRNYTIQVFQEPTHKMQKMTQACADIGLMKVENIGDGRQRIWIKDPLLMFGFVEWYNDWLFKLEKDRLIIKENELTLLNGLLHFSKNLPKSDKGEVEFNLTDVQNESMKELQFVIKVEDFGSLIEKNVVGEKIMKDKGIYCKVMIDEVRKMASYWGILYSLKKIRR